MKRHLLLIALALVAFSCKRPAENYIIPVDYAQFYAEMNASDEMQSQEIGMKLNEAFFRNTVGKEIPDLKVTDMNGQSLRLKNILDTPTIIIFSAHNSSLAKNDVETDFPAIIRSLSEEIEGISVVCLIENSKDYDQKIIEDYAWKLQAEYSKIYYIDTQDAAKMNLITCPTKLYINKKQIVADLQMGVVPDPTAREQLIINGINAMLKEKI